MSLRQSVVDHLLASSPKFRELVERLDFRLDKWQGLFDIDSDFSENVSKICAILEQNTHLDIPLVRFGGAYDGGYALIPFSHDKPTLYSLGVGDNITFDVALSQFCSHIFFVDYSVEGLPQPVPNSTFLKKRIGTTMDSDVDMEGLLKLTANMDTNTNRSALLKMDIEGGEWDVLESAGVSILKRFEQLTIEFHQLFKLRKSNFARRAIKIFEKVTSTHKLVWFHPNNCGEFKILKGVVVADVIEMTFVRNDVVERFDRLSQWSNLNHLHNVGLFQPNDPLKPDFQVFGPHSWHS
jgi:FkbM family methyltransferase